MKMLLICSVIVLGLGCEPSGNIKEQAHIQGTLKTKAGKVEFHIAVDENGTKFFFEQIPNIPDKSSDEEGNPLKSQDDEQKGQ